VGIFDLRTYFPLHRWSVRLNPRTCAIYWWYCRLLLWNWADLVIQVPSSSCSCGLKQKNHGLLCESLLHHFNKLVSIRRQIVNIFDLKSFQYLYQFTSAIHQEATNNKAQSNQDGWKSVEDQNTVKHSVGSPSINRINVFIFFVLNFCWAIDWGTWCSSSGNGRNQMNPGGVHLSTSGGARLNSSG
jgi:hypothetical protein